MILTAGIDVGSSAVKCVIVRHTGALSVIVAKRRERLRHRDVITVAREAYASALAEARARAEDVAYVASTGEGEMVDFRTGHFYGMTSHARGGAQLVPGAKAVLDVGALHARAIVVDDGGRVLRYRMTSQCASGSGQFIENIGRYLGVALEEVGPLSLTSQKPEKCSSICAVLAETDVINMVSRGIATPDILRGIHLSMAARFVKLLEASDAEGRVALSGGLAADVGLLDALRHEAARSGAALEFVSHEDAVLAGALGAALWGRYRLEKLAALEAEAGAPA
jgi:benzoyl-CoA reductase subunit D